MNQTTTAALAALPLTLLLASAAAAQSPTLLRVRNAESVDRLVVDSAGGAVIAGAMNQGAIPASGTGSRMMWYPARAAFRVGYVSASQWDEGNIGSYSVATGVDSRATAGGSVAMGGGSVSSANYAMALGNATVASGISSVATGFATTASGVASTALGHSTTASGNQSIATGFHTVASGSYSAAMGSYASTAGFQGSFVFGDISTTTPLLATAINQFSVRASSGYRFFTNTAMTLGAQLQAGQTSWSALSDRNRKARFLAVDGEDVLARIARVPVSTWIYTDQPDPSVRHIGPMAQDWRAAFGFSADSTTINSADFDGVNLAAAQALAARTDQQAQRIRALEAEAAALRGENAALRAGQTEMRERLLRLERAVAAASPSPQP